MLTLTTGDFFEMLFYVFDVDTLYLNTVVDTLEYVYKRTCIEHADEWCGYFVCAADEFGIKHFCDTKSSWFTIRKEDGTTSVQITAVGEKLIKSIERSAKQKLLSTYILEYKMLQEQEQILVGTLCVGGAVEERKTLIYLTKQGVMCTSGENNTNPINKELLDELAYSLNNPFDNVTYEIKVCDGNIWRCKMTSDVYDGVTVTISGYGYAAETALLSCKTYFESLSKLYLESGSSASTV